MNLGYWKQNHSRTHLRYALSLLSLSLLAILTNICIFSVSVHYDAEIEGAVIIQLKNLYESNFIVRVYHYA